MKSVLISIQPKWCEKIASGEKTIEVRKTRPKIETPFKCYIYCTKHGKLFFHGGIGEKECLFKNPDTGKIKFDYALELMCCKNEYSRDNFLSGKVIGEFICDEVYKWNYDYSDGVDIDDDLILETCLDREDINIYAKGKTLYGWHISDLKIYDKPKELSEFRKPINCGDYDCCVCHNWDRLNLKCIAMNNELRRPPQSWCYVEDLGEE